MNVRRLKVAAKRGWHHAFRLLQRLGLNVLPEHFYSCIPNLGDLARRTDWRKPRSMYGINARNIEAQLALLGEWIVPQHDQSRGASVQEKAIVGSGGDDGYGEIEAEVLFGFVATCKPERIVQIGCGVSTAIILMAAEKADYRPEVVCVEPYPSAYLRDADRKGLIRLIAEPAQLVNFDLLADLNAGGLLFVDSTHAVKCRSFD